MKNFNFQIKFKKVVFKQRLGLFKKTNFYSLSNKNFTENNNLYSFDSSDALQLKEKLIKMSLLNVNKYGWTEMSIKTAANELNYSNNLSALLKNGEMDLIYYTIDNWNNKLKLDLEEIKKNTDLTLDEKYLKAIKLRLSYEIPLINTWPQAMRLGMNPSHIKTTLEKVLNMVNIICSVEDSFSSNPISQPTIVPFTKKYLILKIFLFSEFYMTTDKSYNFKKTWDFVDKLYSFNFNIYSGLSKFVMVNTAVLSMIKYSLIAFLPYDFSQVEEIIRKQEEAANIKTSGEKDFDKSEN